MPFALLDKLGERLAFERAGVRLYQALLSKHEAYGVFPGGPSREDIEHVLVEEQAHFDLLTETIEQLGGDPTELTRSANVQLTASHGVNMVLTDPRVNFIESLEAILVAELADNECWRTLADLARLADQPDLAEQCEGALLTEQEHLEKVRRWLAVGQGRPEPEFEVDVTVEDDGSAGDGGDGAAKSRKRSRSGSAGKSSKSRGK
jgi:rubrerythrin